MVNIFFRFLSNFTSNPFILIKMKYFPDIDDDVPTKFKERKNFSYKKKSFPINSFRLMNPLIRLTSCVSDWIGICTSFRDISVCFISFRLKWNKSNITFDKSPLIIIWNITTFDYHLKQAMVIEKQYNDRIAWRYPNL